MKNQTSILLTLVFHFPIVGDAYIDEKVIKGEKMRKVMASFSSKYRNNFVGNSKKSSENNKEKLNRDDQNDILWKQFRHCGMSSLQVRTLHIFDLDDTLIVTRVSYLDAQASALETIAPKLSGIVGYADLEILRWFSRKYGSGNPELYAEAFIMETRPETEAVEEVVQLFLESYQEIFFRNLKRREGSLEYLGTLIRDGKKIALVSNGRRERQIRKLELTGLREFFSDERIFISGDYEPRHKKPSPFMIRKACGKLDIKPADAVYYGNIVEDVLAGNLAGALTVFLNSAGMEEGEIPRLARPNYTIQNWKEVHRI